MIRRITAALLMAALLFMAGCALADTQKLGHFELSLTLDKASYNDMETIHAELSVHNNASADATGLILTFAPLDGYFWAAGETGTATAALLPAGQTLRYPIDYISLKAAASVPPAGDGASPGLWLLLCAGSLGGAALLAFGGTKAQRMLSLLLCLTLCVPAMHAEAENAPTASIQLAETVLVDNEEITLCAEVSFASMADSDGDGLPDLAESLLSTDPLDPDTDKDGLTDGQEVSELETDPLKTDTDGNGTTDDLEDCDGDGLGNLFEYQNGLNPIVSDTDLDGISDGEERQLGTDPLNPDSDGDGAPDGLESSAGGNPLQREDTFTEIVETEPVGEHQPLSVRVEADVSGEVLGSVNIQATTPVTHPLVRALPGMIGTGYEFTADGDIGGATIRFTYDPALGEPDEDFQPRIYYQNEETQELELLPDQILSGNTVTARIEHFSTYVLLNSVAYDKVWQQNAMIELEAAQSIPLDVVYVVDDSLSSAQTDKKAYRIDNYYALRNLMDNNDRIGYICYDEAVKKIVNLTYSEKAGLVFTWRGRHSGVYKAVERAVEELTGSNAREGAQKHIVLVGIGTTELDWNGVGQLVKDKGITLHTSVIILSPAQKWQNLRTLTENAGGHFYGAVNAKWHQTVYADMTGVSSDVLTDSNGDGLSDLYTALIQSGDITLANGSAQFAGTNFNYNLNGHNSADFDSDGIPNGEEIIVQRSGDRIWIHMKSDPTKADTDGDGYTDLQEKTNKSDPLKVSYMDSHVDTLTANAQFCNDLLAKRYDEEPDFALWASLVDTLSVNLTPTRNCKQILLDFFNDYASSSTETLSQKACQEMLLGTVESDLDVIGGLVSMIDDGNKILKAGTEYVDFAAENQKYAKELTELKRTLQTVRESLLRPGSNTASYVDDVIAAQAKLSRFELSHFPGHVISVGGAKYKNLMASAGSGKLTMEKKITIGLAAFNSAQSMQQAYESYSDLAANVDIYLENLDLLGFLAKNANRAPMRNAAAELYELMDEGASELAQQVTWAFSQSAAIGGINVAVDAILDSNPYTKCLKLLFDAVDVAVGASHHVKCIDNALYLESLTSALRTLAFTSMQQRNDWYQTTDRQVTARYLSLLAKARIMGERNFINYTDYTWLVRIVLPNTHEQAQALCTRLISNVAAAARAMHLDAAEN